MQLNLQILVKYIVVAHLCNTLWYKHKGYEKSDSNLERLEQSNIGKVTFVGWTISTRYECTFILSKIVVSIPPQRYLDREHLWLNTASFNSAILSHVMHM